MRHVRKLFSLAVFIDEAAVKALSMVNITFTKFVTELLTCVREVHIAEGYR